jgi:hypothetical protein
MRIEPVKQIKDDPLLFEKRKKRIEDITHKIAVYFTLLIIIFFFFKMIVP